MNLQTFLIDINIYSVIKTLSIGYLFFKLAKYKLKYSIIGWIGLLFICTLFISSNYSFDSMFLVSSQLLMVLVYYGVFVKEKNLQDFVYCILSVILSVLLTYVIHFYFADDLIWWMMTRYNLFLSYDYNNFLYLIDALTSVSLCLFIHFISRKNFYPLLVSISFVAFLLICIFIFYHNHYLLLIPLSIMILVILLVVVYQIYLDYKKKLEMEKLEREIIRNNLFYSNYKEQYYRLETLKHDIVSSLGKYHHIPEEFYQDIDHLISPLIDIYSSNPILNMILTEKVQWMVKNKIDYEFHIRDDLLTLKEEELLFIFNYVLSRILDLEDIKELSISIKKEDDNTTIVFSYLSNDEAKIQDLLEHAYFSTLDNKYSTIVESLMMDHRHLFVFNMVIKEVA